MTHMYANISTFLAGKTTKYETKSDNVYSIFYSYYHVRPNYMLCVNTLLRFVLHYVISQHMSTKKK